LQSFPKSYDLMISQSSSAISGDPIGLAARLAALSQVLALRPHLDDRGSANGPLRVLPGTHTQGLLTDDQLHDLSTRIPAVECLCPAGGILAMRALLVHASSKSLSPSPRRVLHVEYAVDRNIAEDLELQIA